MPRQSQIQAAPDWPYAEAFAGLITGNHPPPGFTDPPEIAGEIPQFIWPRHYDWRANLGRNIVQPVRLWRGIIEIEDDFITVCNNDLDEWPGRALNLAERRYDPQTKIRVVPTGTPVIIMVGFPPALIDTDVDCTGGPGGDPLEENPPPLFCFDLFMDPFSVYCLCDPGDNPDCPPLPP